MKLILQGLAPQADTVQQIATLAGAARTTQLSDGAFLCDVAADANAISTALRQQIDAACHAAQLDYALLPALLQWRNFGLLAMDMDSTLITIECIDEIADMQGLKPQVAAITEAAMRGEIEFNESLRRRVALLRGLDASALQRVYDERLRLSPGAERMIDAVKAAGLHTLLVSGGFTFFSDRVRERLALDISHANQLEVVEGKLSGDVVGKIVNADEKKATVERVCNQLGITQA
ncbi:MAG: phosphoserine phosphatase SerB, partial [Pseudomonadota bacterium]|nr:phosphoserine phosphatase SerB [Pseudomonadota bacterium]